MPMNDATKRYIDAHLVNGVATYIRKHARMGQAKEIHPLNARLLPDVYAIPVLEPSFSAHSLAWLLDIAEVVAEQFHASAQQRVNRRGRIQPAPTLHIETLLQQMQDPGIGRTPSRNRDIAQTIAVQSPGGVEICLFADLFIKTLDGQEWYFLVDTIVPDRARSRTFKKFILQMAAIRKVRRAEAFAAVAFGSNGDFEPPGVKDMEQFLEVGTDMLVGRAFWTKIGDEHTYDELLEIAENVGYKIRSLL